MEICQKQYPYWEYNRRANKRKKSKGKTRKTFVDDIKEEDHVKS